MALIFPRDLTTGIRWRRASLRLQRRQERAPEAGGPWQARDLGPPLWRAEFQSVPLPLAQAERVAADFETLSGSVETFYAHPAERPQPVDYAGEDLSGVTVSFVATDRRRLQMIGFPASRVQLRAGDFLSIATASGIELLQLAQDDKTGPGGSSAIIEVTQPIRATVEIGQVVTLLNPLVEMCLEPDGFDVAESGIVHRSITFTALQVIR